jgi:transposase
MTYSTLGRPRALTRDQIDAVLEWHRTRKTLKQLARELNVSTTTLANLIR